MTRRNIIVKSKIIHLWMNTIVMLVRTLETHRNVFIAVQDAVTKSHVHCVIDEVCPNLKSYDYTYFLIVKGLNSCNFEMWLLLYLLF